MLLEKKTMIKRLERIEQLESRVVEGIWNKIKIWWNIYKLDLLASIYRSNKFQWIFN